MQSIGCVYIAEHWLSAVINHDFSGLTNNEIEGLKPFINYHAEIVTDSYLDLDPCFTTDHVSGLKANCYLVEFFE